MKDFRGRWPDTDWDQMISWHGTEPVLVPITMNQNDQQAAIYQFMREHQMLGTYVGNVPGSQCWQVKGDSNRVMFALRWT